MIQSNQKATSSGASAKRDLKLSPPSQKESSKKTGHRSTKAVGASSSKGATGGGFKSSIKTMTKFTGNTMISFR